MKVSIIVIVNKKAHSQTNSSSKQFVMFRAFNILPFWKSSTSRPASRNFLKDYSTLRDKAFFYNLAYISGESDRIFVKILSQTYPLTRKSLLNFGSNPDPESVSDYPDMESGCRPYSPSWTYAVSDRPCYQL